MDSIRRRISAHRTGSRIRKAWLDYKLAADGDVPSAAPGVDEGGDCEVPKSAFAMLTEFIESVYSGEGAAGLISEGLNAEWGDILSTIVDVAGRTKGPAPQEEEAFSPGALKNIRWKALSLAEGCMRDEKLREEVRTQWPQAGGRLLQLLQEVQSDKERVLVLRTLERLAHFPGPLPPPPEQLQSLCPDGPGAMVGLLGSEDKEVVQQVLSTLRHLLTALTPSDPPYPYPYPHSLSHSHSHSFEMGPSPSVPGPDGMTPRRPSSASRAAAGSSSSLTLTRALSSSVGRLVGPWLSSLWAPSSSSSRPQSWRGGSGCEGTGWGLERGHEEPTRGAAFVLSKGELEEGQQLLQDLERERASLSWPRSHSSSLLPGLPPTPPVTKQGSSSPLPPSTSEAAGQDPGPTESGMVHLREVMVGQGVLERLVGVMGRAEGLGQGIEVLQSLHLLLRRHVAAQAHFASLDGYTALGQMLCTYSSRGEGKGPGEGGDDVDALLRDAFLLWMGLIADGPLVPGARVRNTAALRGLVSLVEKGGGGGEVEVGVKAVQCLTDLLTLHPLNILALEHVEGLRGLMNGLASALLPFYNTPQDAAAYMSAAHAAMGRGRGRGMGPGHTSGGGTTAEATGEGAARPGGPVPSAEGGRGDMRRCGWRPEECLRLFESVLCLLQHVCILTSDRGDGQVLHALSTLAAYFISLHTRLQHTTEQQADGKATFLSSPPSPSESTRPSQSPHVPSCSGVRCCQCGTEAARVRCLHHGCVDACPASLCPPCDRVLHDAPARKSHIRVPFSPPSAAQPLPPLPSQEAGPWLARFTSLLLTCLRDLLDDRKARNQPLDCFNMDPLMDALVDLLDTRPLPRSPPSPLVPLAEDPSSPSPLPPRAGASCASPALDGSSKGKEGKIGEEREAAGQQTSGLNTLVLGSSSDDLLDQKRGAEPSLMPSEKGAADKDGVCTIDGPGVGVGPLPQAMAAHSENGADKGAEPGEVVLLVLEVLARAVVVTRGQGGEGTQHLEHWRERSGWGLLAFVITRDAVSGRDSASESSDSASRRFALWLLRESLLSWLVVGGGTADLVEPLSWVIHVMRHCVESSIRAPTPLRENGQGGGVCETFTREKGNENGQGQGGDVCETSTRENRGVLCETSTPENRGEMCGAVLQEVRVLVGHVMDRPPPTIAHLAESRSRSGQQTDPEVVGNGNYKAGFLERERDRVQEGPSRRSSGAKELRTHLLSVGVERGGEGGGGSPMRGHGNGRGSVVLGRCAQGWSGLVKRGLVRGGALDLLVRLILHLQQTQTQTQQAETQTQALLSESVACLVEMMCGCLEAKRHLASVVGYSNLPSLLPATLPPLLRFHVLIEASTTERLLPCLPPFTALSLAPSPPLPPAPLDADSPPPSSPWAIQPLYRTLPCLPPLFYRLFFPHTHAPCLPACASLLTHHFHPGDDGLSATSAARVVSPASSLSSSRPASWHLPLPPHDTASANAGLRGYGATPNHATSSVASASSLLHLNFRVRLDDTNHPQGTGGCYDEDGLLPSEAEDDLMGQEEGPSYAISMSMCMELDPSCLHLSRFHSVEAAHLPFRCLCHLPGDVQGVALRCLSRVLDANPDNCRLLAENQSSEWLLRLACYGAPDTLQPLYLQLVAQFCSYSITVPEAKLLFDLASGSAPAWASFKEFHKKGMPPPPPPEQSMTRRELQMQLLYVIGRLVEHRAPCHYFHFDGTPGGVRLRLRDRLGSVKNSGYTLTAWVRPAAFPQDCSVALLSIVGQQMQMAVPFIEVQFSTKRRRSGPLDCPPAYLRLVLRMGDEQGHSGGLPGTATFHVITLQDFEWKEGGAWHQVVLTHEPGGIQVSIDGRGIGGYEATDDCLLQRLYAHVTRDRDLSVNVGMPASSACVDAEATKETASTFLCGQVGAISLLEGAWGEAQIRMATGRFQLDDPPLGLPSFGRRILVADPAFMCTQEVMGPASASASHASGGTAGPISAAQGLLLPSTSSCGSTASGGAGVGMGMGRATSEYSIFSLLAGSKEESCAREREAGSGAGGAASGGPCTQIVGPRVQIHHTQRLPTAVRELGALRLCLPFFLLGPEQQVAALRLLGGIARSSAQEDSVCCQPSNNLLGPLGLQAGSLNVLLHVLTASLSFLTMEVFDVVLDLITSSSPSPHLLQPPQPCTRLVLHPPGLTLVVDLVCYCGHDLSLQLKALEGLVDLLDDNVHNLKAWHSQLGAVACLRLLELHSNSSDTHDTHTHSHNHNHMDASLNLPPTATDPYTPWAHHSTPRQPLPPPTQRLRECAVKLIRVTITSSSCIGHVITRASPSSPTLASGFSSDHLSLLLASLLAHPSSPSTVLLLSLLLRLLQDPGGSSLLSMLRHCLPPLGSSSSSSNTSSHWLAVLDLLSSPSADIRVLAIQLLCLLLIRGRGVVDSKALAQFEKLGGFGAMCENLGHYPPDLATCDALLSLVLGHYAVAPDPGASKGGRESGGGSDFWPRGWSFFSSATEEGGTGPFSGTACLPKPGSFLSSPQPTYYTSAGEPHAASTSTSIAKPLISEQEERRPRSTPRADGSHSAADAELEGGPSTTMRIDHRLSPSLPYPTSHGSEAAAPSNTIYKSAMMVGDEGIMRPLTPSPRHSGSGGPSTSSLFTKLFRRRASHDSAPTLSLPSEREDLNTSPLSTSTSLLPTGTEHLLSPRPLLPAGLSFLPADVAVAGSTSSRRSSFSDASGRFGDSRGPIGGPTGRRGSGEGLLGRRLSGTGSELGGAGEGPWGSQTHPLAMVLPQAVEVLLFVLRRVASPSVLRRSMEGLEACFSPDYCRPHTTEPSATTRRSRVSSDGTGTGDEGELATATATGQAELNMEALMSQKQWLSWFHGLSTTLYVRSVEAAEGAAAASSLPPFALHTPFMMDMGSGPLEAHSLASSVSDSDSFLGSEDGYMSEASGGEEAGMGAASLRACLEMVQGVGGRVMMYDLRLPHRSPGSRHVLDLFKLAEGQLFQSSILCGVLDTLQRSPVLPGEHAGNVLKNLATLLELADEHMTLSLDLCVKGVRAINLLGYKNSTWVRARMRDVRLLDMRTTLATHILTMREVELGHRIRALAHIESALEMLACPSGLSSGSSSSSSSKPCPLSESQMVALLLRYLLDASPSPHPQEALQLTIVRLLSAGVAANPHSLEGRRTLLRVGGEVAPQLLALLGCPPPTPDEQGTHTETPTGGVAGSTGGASAGPSAVGGAGASGSGGGGNMWSLVSGLGRASAPAVSTNGPQQAGEGEAPSSSSSSSMFRLFSGLPSTGGGGGVCGSRSASPADSLFKFASPREAQAPRPGVAEQLGDEQTMARDAAVVSSDATRPSGGKTGTETSQDGPSAGQGGHAHKAENENAQMTTTIGGFLAWLHEDTEERAALKAALDERLQKELTAGIQARDRYWDKKATKQAKSQMQCLERSLKQSLQRQKTLMETSERCSVLSERCSDKVANALSTWNEGQRLRLAEGKNTFLSLQQDRASGGEGPGEVSKEAVALEKEVGVAPGEAGKGD